MCTYFNRTLVFNSFDLFVYNSAIGRLCEKCESQILEQVYLPPVYLEMRGREHVIDSFSVICVGDGKCVICDSYVRPCTLVRICDECNYGSYQGRCTICGGPGVSDAYYCKECTIMEKDVRGVLCYSCDMYDFIYA